jgi:hypothetical protein
MAKGITMSRKRLMRIRDTKRTLVMAQGRLKPFSTKILTGMSNKKANRAAATNKLLRG